MSTHDEVLISIRQIVRAIDLHSKQLNKNFGLTSPQLLLMRTIQSSPKMTLRQLSNNSNMSQATATSILDRLEKRGFIKRERDTKDKRKVHAVITAEGEQVLEQAPQLLQDNFIEQFQALDQWEQTQILSSLQRVSRMMNTPDISPEDLILAIDPEGIHFS
ncbi:MULTISPECIES: MarR family winged helix-turn-helix transcriptional regulator [Vibrio]|uniref:MarR family transcriptional regulator n=1 Tax=Vibrio diazotrophicus TaxID=685 RepID=A0A2J8H570_VIBDI|nr:MULTISPECIES: MarR family transcriptional regulator [Vibrio]MCF7361561.1 MarR family transcriptional regulator [Vibrio sp. A1-b2]MCZ4372916.1 MarR family transcriptional regulator [Vibrio diazotrophicus]PNH81445.1 MarR family transcriptional regulator [Vibrio diazotrophicus]PNH93311.1 MarR family transcriptional regulator [Vibrio diazotrophicus]PNH93425.1 MarR family transcriptional regulator [Vibrio diazotrophicus]